MNNRAAYVCAFAFLFCCRVSGAQESKSPAPRHLTIEEAVQLALKHNHVVRIAGYKVEEKDHAKQLAKSSYYPVLRNDSAYLRVTDTQFIGIPAGSLGTVAGTPLPERSVILNQGGPLFRYQRHFPHATAHRVAESEVRQ